MKRRYGLLVIIKWNNISPVKRSKLSRKLYGGMYFSNYCKYSYPSEGLLGEMPHIKVAGGVFIIREGFEGKIKELFSGTSVKLYIRRVILEDEDMEFLRVKSGRRIKDA